MLEYDRVNNEQREIIYDERRRVLDGESMREYILKMARSTVDRIVSNHIGDDVYPEQWDMDRLNEDLLQIIPMEPIVLDVWHSRSLQAFPSPIVAPRMSPGNSDA